MHHKRQGFFFAASKEKTLPLVGGGQLDGSYGDVG